MLNLRPYLHVLLELVHVLILVIVEKTLQVLQHVPQILHCMGEADAVICLIMLPLLHLHVLPEQTFVQIPVITVRLLQDLPHVHLILLCMGEANAVLRPITPHKQHPHVRFLLQEEEQILVEQEVVSQERVYMVVQ